MKNGLIKITALETLFPGIVSMLLMTGLLILLMITGYLFNANTDDHITAAAKESFALKNDLKGDDIQVHAHDGTVTLTGTVAEEPHLSLVAETIADLPGVRRVDNRLEVGTHSDISGPGPHKLTK
ncbi:MAG: BON domain-containing protein [Candidatus Aminicenantes bacterium]|nr:BON domain-containing protein [Candidatus Aminicenantes bacterium]